MGCVIATYIIPNSTVVTNAQVAPNPIYNPYTLLYYTLMGSPSSGTRRIIGIVLYCVFVLDMIRFTLGLNFVEQNWWAIGSLLLVVFLFYRALRLVDESGWRAAAWIVLIWVIGVCLTTFCAIGTAPRWVLADRNNLLVSWFDALHVTVAAAFEVYIPSLLLGLAGLVLVVSSKASRQRRG